MQQGTGDGSAALESHGACRRVKTQEAGFLCTAKNTTETPGSKWWELTNRIKTDSSHTVWWKDKRKEINMIWNNHSQEVTDFWPQPQSRTPEDKPAAGVGVSSGPAWYSNPEVYQQGAAEDQALCGTAHSNKFCTRLQAPQQSHTLLPHPSSTCPPAMVNTGFGSMYLASGWVTFQALWHFLSAGLVFLSPTPTDPSHSLSLTRVTKRNTAELSRPVEVTLLICLALRLWVLLFSSLTWSLMVPMTDIYQPNHVAFSSSCLTRIFTKLNSHISQLISNSPLV